MREWFSLRMSERRLAASRNDAGPPRAAPFRFISSWFNRITPPIIALFLRHGKMFLAKLTGYRGQYMMMAMPERQMRPPTKSKRPTRAEWFWPLFLGPSRIR